MKFDVIWLPDAESELANIWLAATDRNKVTQAASMIDRALESNAEDEGESRPNGQRIAFFEPLAVRYRIVPGTSRVEVLRVWRY
jgi:hypothetical protein